MRRTSRQGGAAAEAGKTGVRLRARTVASRRFRTLAQRRPSCKRREYRRRCTKPSDGRRVRSRCSQRWFAQPTARAGRRERPLLRRPAPESNTSPRAAGDPGDRRRRHADMASNLADGESASVHPAGDLGVPLPGMVATSAPGFDASPSLAPGRRIEPPSPLRRPLRHVAAPARGIGRGARPCAPARPRAPIGEPSICLPCGSIAPSGSGPHTGLGLQVLGSGTRGRAAQYRDSPPGRSPSWRRVMRPHGRGREGKGQLRLSAHRRESGWTTGEIPLWIQCPVFGGLDDLTH